MKINVVQKTRLAYDSAFQFSHSLNGKRCCFIVSCLGIEINGPVNAGIEASYPTSGVNIFFTVCFTTGYLTYKQGRIYREANGALIFRAPHLHGSLPRPWQGP